jgi:hypothetical protein
LKRRKRKDIRKRKRWKRLKRVHTVCHQQPPRSTPYTLLHTCSKSKNGKTLSDPRISTEKHHSYMKASRQNKPIQIDGVRKCFSFDGKVETASSVPSSQFPLRRLKRVVGACIKTFELSSKHFEFTVVAFILSTKFPSIFLNAYHIAEVDKQQNSRGR